MIDDGWRGSPLARSTGTPTSRQLGAPLHHSDRDYGNAVKAHSISHPDPARPWAQTANTTFKNWH